MQTAWGTFCTRTKLIEQEAQNSTDAGSSSEAKIRKAGKGFDKVQTAALTSLLSKVEAINENCLQLNNTFTQTHTNNVTQIHSHLMHFYVIVIAYKDLPPNCTPESLREALAELAQVESKSESGCFEWIDGLLIQVMEAGDWLLIDNVNFCNPTVLDRLNSVLEPGGVLAVNERGMEADGQIKSVRPHPNFCIFFTMDPHNGEVSRAMRNRGIEICLLEHEVDSRDTIHAPERRRHPRRRGPACYDCLPRRRARGAHGLQCVPP